MSKTKVKSRPVRLKYDEKLKRFYIDGIKIKSMFPAGTTKEVALKYVARIQQLLPYRNVAVVDYDKIDKAIRESYDYSKAVPLDVVKEVVQNVRMRSVGRAAKAPKSYNPYSYQIKEINKRQSELNDTKSKINIEKDAALEKLKLELIEKEKQFKEEQKRGIENSMKAAEALKQAAEEVEQKDKQLTIKTENLIKERNKNKKRNDDIDATSSEINARISSLDAEYRQFTDKMNVLKNSGRLTTVGKKPFDFTKNERALKDKTDAKYHKEKEELLDKLSKIPKKFIDDEEKGEPMPKLEAEVIEVVEPQEDEKAEDKKAIVEYVENYASGYRGGCMCKLADRKRSDYSDVMESFDTLDPLDRIKARNEIIAAGKKQEQNYPGLYSSDINKMMSGYTNYLGAIDYSEIKDLPFMNVAGCIVHFDEHWCALYWSLPQGYIGWIDPFGESPPAKVVKAIRSFVLKTLKPNFLLKFKINNVKFQRINGYNCGVYSVMVLKDLLEGADFPDATKYNTSRGNSVVRQFEGKVAEERAGYDAEKKQETVINKSFGMI